MTSPVRPIANCFTVGRFGDVTPGIALRLIRDNKPYTPNVAVGELWVERATVGGFDFKKSDDGAKGMVYRAMAQRVSQNGERPLYILGHVNAEVPDKVLVRISVENPIVKSLFMHDRELRLAAGTMGGRIILSDGMEKLVEVRNGEALLVFFNDGWVRAFSVENSSMVEISLTHMEMMGYRIDDMLSNLTEEEKRYGGPREQVQKALVAKMLDLFRLTARYDNPEGQDLRMKLIREFFLKVKPATMALMSRALYRVVKDTDPILVHMVEDIGYESSNEGVTYLAEARKKRVTEEAALSPEQREDRRLANIRHNKELQAAKEARQAEFKAKHKPQPKPEEGKKNTGGKKAKHMKDHGEERKRA